MSNIHYAIGIDPGANGAMAILTIENKIVKNIDLFDFKKNGIKEYVRPLKLIDSSYSILIEQVHAMRGQGVSSTFSFGQRLGELEGMLQTLDLTYSKVIPQKWQKLVGVEPKSGKKGIYSAISNIYPNSQLTGKMGGILDGRCDALSIAYYNYKTKFETKE